MKTTARTSIPTQRTPAGERTGSTRTRPPEKRHHSREGRRTILALASVVAAIAAVVTLVTLVATGGDGGGASSPQNQVVAPGPDVSGSDQHLYNRAHEHAPYTNSHNPGLSDFG